MGPGGQAPTGSFKGTVDRSTPNVSVGPDGKSVVTE